MNSLGLLLMATVNWQALQQQKHPVFLGNVGLVENATELKYKGIDGLVRMGCRGGTSCVGGKALHIPFDSNVLTFVRQL